MLSSIGRRDYSRLAKATADDLVRSYAAAARSSSNYGELVSQASTLKSQENAALTKISGELTGKAIKARTDIKTNKIINEAKADYKQNVRKAGVLAAAGEMFGSIKDAGGKKPIEPYKSKTDYAGKEADLRTKAETELSKITPVDLDLSTTTTTDTSTTTGSKPGQTTATATTVNTDGFYSGGTLSQEDSLAIRSTAQRLGVDPYTLGGLFEMESSHNPNVWGGAGGKYRGLIQFGPGARSEVGLPGHEMTISEQLPYVEKYFNQRGFKKGMGATELYRTVLVGNPYQSGTDSWDTNSDEAALRMMPGGDLYKRAQSLYGSWNPNSIN
jgi:hypothetical protein